jgi:hypothetical protein
MFKPILPQMRLVAQEGLTMRCRVWNENLAAFWVAAPLASVPEPTIDAPTACEREGEAAAW